MSSDNRTEQLRSALGALRDPETGRRLVETGQLTDLDVAPTYVLVEVALTTHSLPVKEIVEQQITDVVRQHIPDAQLIEVIFGEHHRPPPMVGTTGLRCRSAIAVASGKGGVGKSTVAVCLALALQRAGCSVGLLDADVYGPSVPHLLDLHERPAKMGNKIQPVDARGIPVMSIGLMVPADQAIIWRGPMLHGAVTQFLQDTSWGDLDYLIIDMPPGTGDVALSLSQILPLTGAVIVCTPQKVALLDAAKAVAMFRKVNIPLLGLVENMSTFICPDSGKQYDIFGHGGAQQYARQQEIPFLGEIPINLSLREKGDAGTMHDSLDDPQVGPYLKQISVALVQELSRRAESQPSTPSLPVLG